MLVWAPTCTRPTGPCLVTKQQLRGQGSWHQLPAFHLFSEFSSLSTLKKSGRSRYDWPATQNFRETDTGTGQNSGKAEPVRTTFSPAKAPTGCSDPAPLHQLCQIHISLECHFPNQRPTENAECVPQQNQAKRKGSELMTDRRTRSPALVSNPRNNSVGISNHPCLSAHSGHLMSPNGNWTSAPKC